MKLPPFVRLRTVNRSPENEEEDGGEAKKWGRNEIERQRWEERTKKKVGDSGARRRALAAGARRRWRTKKQREEADPIDDDDEGEGVRVWYMEREEGSVWFVEIY